ncbi:MAG: riboflavin synthase [Alphaproteobacteria bacterium]
MFTGLIGPMGQVSSREGVSEVKFTIASSWAPDTYVIGESIACDGACMTVVDWADGELGSEFSFIASAETLECTTLSNWKAGRSINLERALRFGDSLGGHLVSGHIDGLAQLTDRTEENGSLRLSFQVTDQHKGFIASKGSVALNGVSLTVNEVDGAQFGVNIVPHTLSKTNLGGLEVGAFVNFEADTLARYVARHIELGVI